MGNSGNSVSSRYQQFKALFIARDVVLNDGRDLKRFSVGGRAQAWFATMAAVTLAFSAYGVAQATAGAVEASGISGAPLTPEQEMHRMAGRMAAMQADVEAIKQSASAHAALVEQRQNLLNAAITGKGEVKAISVETPAIDSRISALGAEAIAPFKRIEARQAALAIRARYMTEQRLAAATGRLRKLGIAPERFLPAEQGMGGPFEAADSAEAAADMAADAQFRSLFMTWRRLDAIEQVAISVPSLQPVDRLSFSSYFGVRSDPFRGTAAMHAGVDIPGAIGTPVYATADGLVDHAGISGGYGNMIEIDHGKGIQTRYGHLSKILVADGTRVKRGQLIALMGSTGRSTGPHLHYEVRIDGHAVNPVPFLQNADYVLAAQDRSLTVQPTSGGAD